MLEDTFDDRPKPPNGIRIELVIDSWTIHNAFDQANVAKHFEMLRRGCLCDRQVFNNITGDAAWMRDQVFHDLETDGIPQCLEHGHQPVLVEP